jgi:hypothetical protein
MIIETIREIKQSVNGFVLKLGKFLKDLLDGVGVGGLEGTEKIGLKNLMLEEYATTYKTTKFIIF